MDTEPRRTHTLKPCFPSEEGLHFCDSSVHSWPRSFVKTAALFASEAIQRAVCYLRCSGRSVQRCAPRQSSR